MHNPLLAPAAFLLQQHPQGLSEFELIKLLQERCDFIPEAFSGDVLSLFRTHFLLFNALYQLQVSWINEGLGYVNVNAMSIQYIPSSSHTASQVTLLMAGQSEALRDYYLDMDNLTEMERGDVETLLSGFWAKYIASDARVNALAVLELQDPVTMSDIKLAYRRKAMLLHPDRGGDVAALQEVNAAMEQLKTYYFEK